MTFQFETPKGNRSNLAAKVTDCDVCDGHRMVPVDTGTPYEAYARCPACNAAPLPEPPKTDGWWADR